MLYRLNSTQAFRFGLALAAALITGAAVSPVLGEEIADHETKRFFDSMPPGLMAMFASPEMVLEKAGETDPERIGDRRVPPEALYPYINDADLNGRPIIEFEVADERGAGVAGFVQGENVQFGFTVVKLVPGSNGATSQWQSYILSADEGVENAQPSTFGSGTLEGTGDGRYTFTFDRELEEISGVLFEPELTHRIGMEIRGARVMDTAVPGSDAVLDIQPSTGHTTDIERRRIVEQESCASCHGTRDFAFHGGPRQSVEMCTTCHVPDAIDVGTGNTIDFTVMIHKIHAGGDLETPLQICGYGCENFGAPPSDFSHVAFPQSLRNCTTCHDPANPNTPEAVQVYNRGTAEQCASCHDQLAFDENGLTNARRNHPGFAQPNEVCSACHSQDGFLPSVLESHAIPSQLAARRFQYNILEVRNTGEWQSPVITFSITDPTNDDRPYDITSDPEFTGSATSVNMDIAWPNSDYTNIANDAGTDVSGRPASVPASINLANGSGSLPAYMTDNGDGTYTVDTGALAVPLVIPAANPPLGSGTVVIEGHPAADWSGEVGSYDDQVPVTAATLEFAITDVEPQARRQVVAMEKCQSCHGLNDGLAFHGNNRTDNPQACVVCHNPNATDLFRRPVDTDGIFNGTSPDAADFLEDRSVDFKYMIHAIHAGPMREDPYVAYGFGTRPHDFSHVGFPRSPSDCLACHESGTYALPLGDNVLATTFSSGATVFGGSRFGASAYDPDDGSASDPSDDHNVSATAAVCSSCHDSPIAIEHMSRRGESAISFGNAFIMNPDPVFDPDTQHLIEMAEPENCSFCHGPGGFVDVADVHGVND